MENHTAYQYANIQMQNDPASVPIDSKNIKPLYRNVYKPYSGNPRKRQRTTPEQTKALEEVFSRTQHPSAPERSRLASELQMKPRSVQIWFQNRRAKEKNTSKKSSPTRDESGSEDEMEENDEEGKDFGMNVTPPVHFPNYAEQNQQQFSSIVHNNNNPNLNFLPYHQNPPLSTQSASSTPAIPFDHKLMGSNQPNNNNNNNVNDINYHKINNNNNNNVNPLNNIKYSPPGSNNISNDFSYSTPITNFNSVGPSSNITAPPTMMGMQGTLSMNVTNNIHLNNLTSLHMNQHVNNYPISSNTQFPSNNNLIVNNNNISNPPTNIFTSNHHHHEIPMHNMNTPNINPSLPPSISTFPNNNTPNIDNIVAFPINSLSSNSQSEIFYPPIASPSNINKPPNLDEETIKSFPFQRGGRVKLLNFESTDVDGRRNSIADISESVPNIIDTNSITPRNRNRRTKNKNSEFLAPFPIFRSKSANEMRSKTHLSEQPVSFSSILSETMSQSGNDPQSHLHHLKPPSSLSSSPITHSNKMSISGNDGESDGDAVIDNNNSTSSHNIKIQADHPNSANINTKNDNNDNNDNIDDNDVCDNNDRKQKVIPSHPNSPELRNKLLNKFISPEDNLKRKFLPDLSRRNSDPGYLRNPPRSLPSHLSSGDFTSNKTSSQNNLDSNNNKAAMQEDASMLNNAESEMTNYEPPYKRRISFFSAPEYQNQSNSFWHNDNDNLVHIGNSRRSFDKVENSIVGSNESDDSPHHHPHPHSADVEDKHLLEKHLLRRSQPAGGGGRKESFSNARLPSVNSLLFLSGYSDNSPDMIGDMYGSATSPESPSIFLQNFDVVGKQFQNITNALATMCIAVEKNNLNHYQNLYKDFLSVVKPPLEGKFWTPLHSAVKMENIEYTKSILESPIFVNVSENHEHFTALHITAVTGNFEICSLLLQHGAKVDVVDKRERTPLYYSCVYGHEPIVKLLLKHNANVECKDEDGHTPLQAAALYGFKEIAALIVQFGANINAKDNDDHTALYYAVRSAHNDTAYWLRERGAKDDLIN